MLEMPRLHSALKGMRRKAHKADHAPAPVTNDMVKRAEKELRNKRAFGIDDWTPLELKSLPEAAMVSLTFSVRHIDVKVLARLQSLANMICLMTKLRRASAPLFFRLCCTCCGAADIMYGSFVVGTLPGRFSSPAARDLNRRCGTACLKRRGRQIGTSKNFMTRFMCAISCDWVWSVVSP